MKTYRLTFDVSEMSYVGAVYATTRAEARMRLEDSSGSVVKSSHEDDELVWIVSVAAETAVDAVGEARKNLGYDATLVKSEELG